MNRRQVYQLFPGEDLFRGRRVVDLHRHQYYDREEERQRHMASRLFVRGRTPKTRHGHDDANAITSKGGGPRRRAATDVVVAAVAAVVVISPRSPGARPFEEQPAAAVRRIRVQRDPSRNATESSAVNNRGISRQQDFFPREGFHRRIPQPRRRFRKRVSEKGVHGGFPNR